MSTFDVALYSNWTANSRQSVRNDISALQGVLKASFTDVSLTNVRVTCTDDTVKSKILSMSGVRTIY